MIRLQLTTQLLEVNKQRYITVLRLDTQRFYTLKLSRVNLIRAPSRNKKEKGIRKRVHMSISIIPDNTLKIAKK